MACMSGAVGYRNTPWNDDWAETVQIADSKRNNFMIGSITDLVVLFIFVLR
jgi:hypothetical protein